MDVDFQYRQAGCGFHGLFHLFLHLQCDIGNPQAVFHDNIQVDRHFPRSLVFGLQAVQDSLAELDPVNVKARTDAISRVVGRVRSGLEYMDPTELAVDLHDRMEQVQMAVLDVSRRLSKRYFEGAELSVWRREEVLCD